MLKTLTVMTVWLGTTVSIAQATLVGDSVDIVLPGGWIATPMSPVVVDPGIEAILTLDSIVSPEDFFSLDIDESTITLTQIHPTSELSMSGDGTDTPRYFTISNLDWVGLPRHHIAGAKITAKSRISGIDNDDVIFSDHSVSLNIINSGWGTRGQLVIGLTPGSKSIPEPVTSLLGLISLGVLDMATRRQVSVSH